MNNLRPIGTRFEEWFYTYQNDYEFDCVRQVNQRHCTALFEVIGYGEDRHGKICEIIGEVQQ